MYACMVAKAQHHEVLINEAHILYIEHDRSVTMSGSNKYNKVLSHHGQEKEMIHRHVKN